MEEGMYIKYTLSRYIYEKYTLFKKIVNQPNFSNNFINFLLLKSLPLYSLTDALIHAKR